MIFFKEGWDAWLRGCVEFKAIKLRGTLQTHSSSIILSGLEVVYPYTSTYSLSLCLEVCVGGGYRAPQPVTKILVGIPPPCVMAFRGLVWGLDNIYLPPHPPRPAGGYIMGPNGPSGG